MGFPFSLSLYCPETIMHQDAGQNSTDEEYDVRLQVAENKHRAEEYQKAEGFLGVALSWNLEKA